MKDKLPPHKFGPGHDIEDIFNVVEETVGQKKHPYIGSDGNTHSLGIRPHPHGNKIARQLLNLQKAGLVKSVEVVQTFNDDRPLIDKLHEATFHDTVPMQYIQDKYALRMLLRKAQRFTLDDDTSRMVAEFSLVVAQDLDTVRQLAIPPFPVTWIDINNVARLNRIKELGGRLTPTAAGETEAGSPVDRVGWLIWPASDLGGHYMVHVVDVEQGVMVSPLAWWWHNDQAHPLPIDMNNDEERYVQRLTFGIRDCGVTSVNASVMPTSLHLDHNRAKLFRSGDQVRELMHEIAGELRHLFGFLMALAATKSSTIDQKAPSTKKTMPNGKPLFHLEHKIMHLHLRPKTTARDAILRAVTRHKMREHPVRAHLRTLQSGRIIKVQSHKRGDPALGRIIRDETKVEK